MDIATLGLRVDASGAITSLNQFEGALGMAKKAAGALGVAVGAGAIFGKFVEETKASQYAMAQLEAAVKSTGAAAGFTATQLDDISKAEQQLTTYSDEAVKGAQSLLLTFNQIKGDQFIDATKAVEDLATRMGGDLQGAALQVGKALQDPEHGLLALRRAGVSFTESQTETIKSLFASGHAAEAQALILKELQLEFGGSAAAAKDTFGGALKSLGNDFGDLFEMEKSATSGLVSFINMVDRGAIWLRQHADELKAVAVALGSAGMLGAVIKLGPAMAALYSVEAIAGLAAMAAPFLLVAAAGAVWYTVLQEIRAAQKLTADEAAAHAKDGTRQADAKVTNAKRVADAQAAAAAKAKSDHDKAIADLTDEIAKTEAKYKLIAENIPLYDKLLAAQQKLADLEGYEKAKQGWRDIGLALDKAAASAERYARAAGSALGVSTSEGLGAAPGVSNALGAAAIAKGDQMDAESRQRRYDAWVAYYEKLAHEEEQIQKQLLKSLQTAFATFFDDVLSHGIASWEALGASLKSIILKSVSEAASAEIMQKFGEQIKSMLPGGSNGGVGIFAAVVAVMDTIHTSLVSADNARAAEVARLEKAQLDWQRSMDSYTKMFDAMTAYQTNLAKLGDATFQKIQTALATLQGAGGNAAYTSGWLNKSMSSTDAGAALAFNIANLQQAQGSGRNVAEDRALANALAELLQLQAAFNKNAEAAKALQDALDKETEAKQVAAEWTRKYTQAFAEGGLRERDLRAQGMTAQADAEATFWRRAAEYADAVAKGFDASFLAHMHATWDLEDQAIANAQKFSAAIIQTAAATKALSGGFLDANVEVAINSQSAAIVANIQNQIGATQLQLDAAKSVAAALKSAVSELQKAADSIKSFGDGLLTGSLSPLSPTALLDETRRQFEDAARKAAFGDAAAGQQVGSLGTSFLNASRAVNASGAGYSADFAQVQAMVAAAQGGVGGALDTATQALDENVKQTDLLTKMVAGLNNLIALQQQVAAQTIADFKSGARTGPWQGFASGGDFGGGVALVGEQGPELMNTGSARFFNASQTAAMLGGGANEAIGALTDVQKFGIRVQQDVGQQTVAALTDLRREMAELRAQVRRSA